VKIGDKYNRLQIADKVLYVMYICECEMCVMMCRV
jgi:hypothetical protein